jgi:membrane protein
MTSTPKPTPTSVPPETEPIVQEPLQSPKERHQEEARQIWTVTRMGVMGLYQSQLPRMAAALAYRTIFSIIPVMAIGLLIFGSIVSDEQVESGVRRVLTFAGISQISTIEESTVHEVDGDLAEEQIETTPPEAADDPDSSVDTPSIADDPFAGADLEEVITDLINRVNGSIRNVPTGWIALTSGLVLFYAAMSMLIEIEKAFNQICSAPSGRGWLRRLMLYWTILTAGSLMLAATFLAGDAFTGWIISIAGQDSMVGAIMAGYGVSVLISTVLLLGAYLTIPNTKIKFRSALAGAFFAAVLWELGKLGFTTYLHYTTGYAKFYGSIAILPLFLLWIYLTWLIVLFGMQVSYTLQNFTHLVESGIRLLTNADQRDPSVIDPLVMFAVANEIQSGFVDGKPSTIEKIASSINMEPSQTTQLVAALCEVGLVNRVYEGDELLGFSPARPAERIGLDEILKAGYRVDGFRKSGTDTMLPAAIRDAVVDACSGKTLADLGSDQRSEYESGARDEAGND